MAATSHISLSALPPPPPGPLFLSGMMVGVVRNGHRHHSGTPLRPRHVLSFHLRSREPVRFLGWASRGNHSDKVEKRKIEKIDNDVNKITQQHNSITYGKGI